MPDTSLDEALQEAYASAPSKTVIYSTLEMIHPAFITPIRVVRDIVPLVATLEADAPVNPGEAVTFAGYAFELELPEINENANVELSITIDNVSLDIEDAINSALQSTEKIEAIYRPYLSTDLSAPAMSPPLRMTVVSVSATQFKITARATIGDYANRRWPYEEYTVNRFRGLAR